MNSFHPKPSLARRRGNTIPHRRRHESKLRCRAGQCTMALREGWGIRLGGQSKKNPSLASLKKVTSAPIWNRRCHERDWLRRLGIGVREAGDLAAEVRHATGHWRERGRLRGGDGAPADGPVPRWRLLPAWAPHL